MGLLEILKFSPTVSHFGIFLCLMISFENIFALDACNFRAIVNFGDSNSDTGGYSSAFGPVSSPYGQTYFGTPSGRLSDGRLVIDFLANYLGLPFINSYLNSMGSNFTQGANFAIAGATIKPSIVSSPVSLAIQLTEFQIFKSRLPYFRKQGGIFGTLIPKEEDISKALYIIDIGHNDIAHALLNMNIEEANATLPDLVNRVAQHVQALYELGARSFWIHNTGPLGCLAYLLELPISQGHYDHVGCAENINTVVQNFNQKLDEAVVGLRSKLIDAAITYVDVYSIKYSLFKTPKIYGFVDPLVVCCGTNGKYNYNKSIICGIGVTSCSDPSAKVNWDGIHFTDAANKVVFDQILTGSFSNPPILPSLSCHRSYVQQFLSYIVLMGVSHWQ